jgi:UDP-N-acetylglucosamine 1-carboxyvinyltransferase
MDFKIQGGKKLSGKITNNTSKNGALGLLCTVLLNKSKTTLKGIPRIEEVSRICEVLESIGVKFEWTEKNTLVVNPPTKLDLDSINFESASRTRAILMFLAPLMHQFETFKLPHSDGCKLGKRTIAPHLYALQEFGLKVEITDNYYEVDATQVFENKKSYKEYEIVMMEAGDTATENIIMAASLMNGKTTIKFAASNYMVQDVCFFLETLGVKIEGIGTSTLVIYGKSEINEDAEFENSEDPIEGMMWLSAAICTKSELEIQRLPIDFLELELFRLKIMGFEYKILQKYKAKNGKTNLVDIQTFPSKLTAGEDKITCGAYPDINIDNLPFFVPVCSLATGQSLIHDWIYENRAIYFMELTRLGAKMILADPHRVFIEGVPNFQPAQVVCPPALRPAMIVLIAMLAAPGQSILRNVYSIRRGYEEIAERLNSLGAEIEVLVD